MESQEKNQKSLFSKKRVLLLCAAFIVAAYFVTVFYRAYTLRRAKPQEALTAAEQSALTELLSATYPEQYAILKPLPYKTKAGELSEVGAKSAIAVDALNGCVLYEKNADEVIPPASMTKLFVMYVVFEEIAKGNASYDDVVPLVPQSWACNMPPHSSLMFLGKNQVVTLEELLLGLAICSGNDASYAIAYYLFGGIEPFIARMNELVQELGLSHTHFVETSGYSEQNVTTAREMAAFACLYLKKYPESLYKFHSHLDIRYPQKHNLAPEDRNKAREQDFSEGLPEHITMEIYQKNTNPLLGKLSGCDGLKTGYIDESGYNLALTAKRGQTRILSVTMGGLGSNVQEGQANRVKDGTAIMEWAFSTFEDYKNPLVLRQYSIPSVFTKTRRVNLVPAFSPDALTVPKTIAKNPAAAQEEVKINLVLPNYLKGALPAGTECGKIQYTLGDHLLQEIPLVVEKTSTPDTPWQKSADLLAQFALR